MLRGISICMLRGISIWLLSGGCLGMRVQIHYKTIQPYGSVMIASNVHSLFVAGPGLTHSGMLVSA